MIKTNIAYRFNKNGALRE